ncbi:MAG: hypothetical protein WC343_05940 [Bacilli bacterium]|jgi:hypothetical protein
MKRLALLLLALVLLAPAVGAVEVWEKQLGSEITAIVTDETGATIFVGTDTGSVYRYDADGTQIGSPISLETCPVTNLVLTQDGSQLAVQYQETGTSAVYLVNTGTGAEWFNVTDPDCQYGVAVRPDGSAWYILAHESTDTGLDYLAVITPEHGAWFTVPDLLPGTFIVSGDGSWAAGAEGTVQTTADLIPLSGLPPLSELPALSGLLSPSDLPLLSDYYTAGASSGGIATLDDGRVKIYRLAGPGYWGAYAATNTKFSNTTPLTIQFDYSKPAGFNAQFAKALRLYAVTDSANATRSTAYYFYQSPTSDQALLWTNDVTSAAMTEVTLWLDGTGNISTDGSNWTAIDGWSNVGDTFNLELHNADYGNYPGWFDNLTVDALTFYPEIRPTTLSPSATQAYSGTITHIAGTEVGTRFAVSTTSNLYLQQITESAFGDTVTLGPRAGTPYVLTLAHEGAFIVEGRNNLIDIFRTDGAQVGTYTAGGPVRHVDVAQANGLYAAGGSDDGKYYVFSKDVSSSWYLLHASDSASPVTALAMSWRGEIVLIGRSNGRLVAFQPAVEEEYPGTIRLTVYKDALPYAGAQIAIEHGGTDQAWDEPTTTETDDYGVAPIPVQWGEYVRVTVGDGELQRVILPASSQTDHILRIKGPDPLRTGAQYSSGYDPATQRIYLHYDDTREKTHRVVYTITRSADNTVVFVREYATLPVDDYYQIPAGWTNSSYRIQLTASGSPSYTNTWSQWVGADGVASLHVDLDSYAKMGISFFLILFVAGLFSYISGPQGAIVVTLFAGALVLWGWLPLPPVVVALCVVWAFLGLLGRTSGE